MRKLSTLFKKDQKDLSKVTEEIDPQNEWVFKEGIPTKKFDGTSCAIIRWKLYKRYDCKIDKVTGKYKKPIPTGAISCQSADKITGHHPHWIRCEKNNPADKYHIEALNNLIMRHDTSLERLDGTYELCGEKVQGNPENLKGHHLIRHGDSVILGLKDFSYESIKEYLSDPDNDIEGIVFHHEFDDRMCKIRKCDFGIKR